MVPILVPEGGFYRICRTKWKAKKESRILCTEDCNSCPHYVTQSCANLEQLNFVYEEELREAREVFKEKQKKQEPVRIPLPVKTIR
jgi:hypothetical protein